MRLFTRFVAQLYGAHLTAIPFRCAQRQIRATVSQPRSPHASIAAL
ncbi:hypothetical protein ACMT1E_04260 [Sphingomonas flavalba]